MAWTAEETEQLVAWFDEGVSQSEIARRANRSQGSVYNRLATIGKIKRGDKGVGRVSLPPMAEVERRLGEIEREAAILRALRDAYRKLDEAGANGSE
jgi:transposase